MYPNSNLFPNILTCLSTFVFYVLKGPVFELPAYHSYYLSIYISILCIAGPLFVLLFTYLSIYIHILCIAGPCPWATSLTVYLPVYLYYFSMSCRALSLSYLPTCLTMYLPVYLLSYSMSCRALSLSYSPGRIILARLGSAGVDVCVRVCVCVWLSIYAVED